MLEYATDSNENEKTQISDINSSVVGQKNNQVYMHGKVGVLDTNHSASHQPQKNTFKVIFGIFLDKLKSKGILFFKKEEILQKIDEIDDLYILIDLKNIFKYK